MKKYVVLSVNDNVDYLYFTPLTCWAWRKFGWEPIVFYHRTERNPNIEKHRSGLGLIEQLIEDTLDNLTVGMTAEMRNLYSLKIHFVDPIEGYRNDTITQISRLYGACAITENPMQAYLMTCDIDMIPLSNYWNPSFEDVTVWGHDLTGFKNYPLCYIGAPMTKWLQVMNLTSNDYNALIKRDLDTLPQAKSHDFYTYWETDQDLITKRLKEYGTEKITFINRGQGKHGFARGRVDKGNGGWVLDQPELIDAHLLQQCHHSEEKIHKLMNLLHHVWPNEDWKWFLQYTKEFKKLAV